MGADRPATLKALKISRSYFDKVFKAPVGQDEWRRINAAIEQAYLSQVADTSLGKHTPTQSALTDEIDESVLESVQELRAILRNSKSDNAKAIAARELLDLAQAKKRYATAIAGSSDSVPIDADDIAALTAAIADLRSLSADYEPYKHAIGGFKDPVSVAIAAKERRDSASMERLTAEIARINPAIKCRSGCAVVKELDR